MIIIYATKHTDTMTRNPEITSSIDEESPRKFSLLVWPFVGILYLKKSDQPQTHRYYDEESRNYDEESSNTSRTFLPGRLFHTIRIVDLYAAIGKSKTTCGAARELFSSLTCVSTDR